MGIRTAYLRLSKDEIFKIVKYIKENGDTEICNICEKECKDCPVKNRQSSHVLIESLIPLALTLAKKFARPNNREELISLSLYTLVESVSRIEKLRDIDKFPAYVNSRIMCKLKQFILTDGVITLKINRVKGNENLLKVYPIKDYVKKYTTTLPLELRELIETVVTNEIEQTIINCIIMGGYTNIDIANECGKSPGRISQIKSDLFERLANVL